MNEKAKFGTFTLPERTSPPADFKGILMRYIYHWPLFIIGLSVSLSAATLYLKVTKPSHEVRATILIKDEKKNPDQSALHEIDLSNSSKLIENELEVLKSKSLIRQVVNDLQLWAVYMQDEGLLCEEIYNTRPFQFHLLSGTDRLHEEQLLITLKDGKHFLLKNPNGTTSEYRFGQILSNSFGTWKLEALPGLSQYRGHKIRLKLFDPDKRALAYQQQISISLLNKLATTVSLSIKDPIPNRAKDILNRLIANYNDVATSEKKRETKNTLHFIDKRLSSLTGELTDAEKEIEGFKVSRGLTDISSESRISLENMQANDAKLNEVSVQLSIIQSIERYINNSKNAGSSPATLGINDPALQSLVEKFSELQLQRDRLLATTPETNPDFEPINRQITSTRDAIRENVKNIRNSLINTRNKLETFNAHFESSIKNVPSQERQYISIKRQQAIKENLYTYLLQKREEVAVSYASSLTDDRVVDQAYLAPERPRSQIAYALALFLGFGLPISLIWSRENFSNRVKDIREIQTAVPIPVISELPYVNSRHLLTVRDKEVSPIGDQFRALRARLHFLHEDRGSGRITLLSSSIPGEGKSFVSSNLSLALAFSGRRTLLLELDMRRPKLAKAFGLAPTNPGMSEYLSGEADLNSIIQNSGRDKRLDLISCGSFAGNHSELLEQKNLRELLEILRTQYDDILIDSPPIHLVPDALVLSRLSDLTLFIIRQGITDLPELSYLRQLYEQQQLQHVHIVFNGIHKKKYGYGYDYSHTYYESYSGRRIGAAFSDFSNRF